MTSTSEHLTTPAFDGLTVLDLTVGIAGPIAGMLLADNGARVIKVEPPEGDWARGSRGFLMWNRGKESIVLDLRGDHEREAFLDLVANADILLQSFRPGVAARLGIGDEVLRSVNPRLVRCSITGFGTAAAFEDLKGYEDVVSAKLGRLRGLDEIRGAIPGRGERGPVYLLATSLSYAASQLALQGIVGGLLSRERTGEGTLVETSLVQAATTLSMRRAFERPHTEPAADGAWSDSDLRYRGIKLTFLTVRCADGRWLQMCARTDHHFRTWVQAVGLHDVLEDPRYAHAPLGIESAAALDELEDRLRAAMGTRTQDEWMHTFTEEVDVPCDPFLTPQEFLAHPQMRENDRVVEIEDPDFGVTTQLGPLVLGASTTIGAPAPRLGEHTEAVLGERRTPSPQPPLARAAATQAAPLQGVTVLELAYYIAGPLGAACLAELGARVIKIEPREGDPWRPVGLESVHMLHGKESIVLDLKSPAGRTALQKLVAMSDVLITSFRPQAHHRLGFDYETARRLNPSIIHLYAASYGSRGPWSDRAAFHSTPNALCGSGILQAGRDNPPVDDDYPDPVAGVSVGTAVAIALWARRRSGLGQHLETSMLCSGGYAFSDHLVLCDGLPAAPIPDSEQLGVSALRRLYQCAPGWLMLSAVQEREWSSLAEALDRLEWLTDVRFSSAAGRARHDQVLAQLIATELARRSADHWEQTLRKHDVGAARADGMSFEGFLIEHYDLAPASHPTFGDYYRLPPKVHIAGTTPRAAPACGVGEHTRSILEEIGCAADMVEEMTAYQAGGR